MAKREERVRALRLRRQGKSYSQIKKEIGVSKSTLSCWLRTYPLNKKQIEKLMKLRATSEVRIERYRETMRKKREKRIRNFYEEEKKELLPLGKKEFYIVGLFLYWGEGVKGIYNSIVGLNNTDPQVLKFFYDWLTIGLGIPKKKIKVCLHLYSDMDIEKEKNYWSEKLGISLTRFYKPYIKKSTRKGITHKGFGHGTCGLRVLDARVKEKIMMGIKIVADQYFWQLRRNIDIIRHETGPSFNG